MGKWINGKMILWNQSITFPYSMLCLRNISFQNHKEHILHVETDQSRDYGILILHVNNGSVLVCYPVSKCCYHGLFRSNTNDNSS